MVLENINPNQIDAHQQQHQRFVEQTNGDTPHHLRLLREGLASIGNQELQIAAESRRADNERVQKENLQRALDETKRQLAKSKAGQSKLLFDTTLLSEAKLKAESKTEEALAECAATRQSSGAEIAAAQAETAKAKAEAAEWRRAAEVAEWRRSAEAILFIAIAFGIAYFLF